jgi:hypothetical protein
MPVQPRTVALRESGSGQAPPSDASAVVTLPDGLVRAGSRVRIETTRTPPRSARACGRLARRLSLRVHRADRERAVGRARARGADPRRTRGRASRTCATRGACAATRRAS